MKNIKIQNILIIIFAAFLWLHSETSDEKPLPRGNGKLFRNATYFNENDKTRREYQELIKKIKYLKDTIEIKVIYRELPPYFCGLLSSASFTLAINKEKDTIGIISLCDMDDRIKAGNNVIAFPWDTIGINLDIIGNSNLGKINKHKTYFGNMKQK